MGADSKIEWTHHTFNPWWGCTKVSPGCDHCYAETFDKRIGGKHWGKGVPRRVFGDKHWNEPRRWDRAALASGERRRVFCASMADWADAEAPEGQRERLFALIRETPNLDWLLLTKRHGRIRSSLPLDWGDGYPNVWLGVSVDTRAHGFPRIDVLRTIPARVRFLSVEPLLEDLGQVNLAGIHWAIIGGESGHHARPFSINWARALVRQARASGVAPFMKQLGAAPLWPSEEHVPDEVWARWDASDAGAPTHYPVTGGLADPKGGDWTEWPADVRIREFPRP